MGKCKVGTNLDLARNTKVIMTERRRERGHGLRQYWYKVIVRHGGFILNEMKSLEGFQRQPIPFTHCKVRQLMVGHPTDWDDICNPFQL